MARKSESNQFEKSLEELEAIVSQMETGELSLEESLNAFEKGIKLTKDCQKALEKAEQKVNKLLEKENQFDVEPFDTDSDNN